MNLLVTGGAGFIGSHFVLRHIERYPEDTVIVLDKLTYAADKSFLDPVLNRIRFVQGDIVDFELVAQLFQRYGIDVVVNFAAETHVDRSIKSAVPFLHTNVLGVQSLVEACKLHPNVLLFHISTDEVYGDLRDEDKPKRPEDSLRPSSPYAASKASGDLLLLAAARTYGIRVRISRCTNNYGPHQAGEKFIPTIIRHALKDEAVPLYAEGKNKRDWLFVWDHCDALEMILQQPESPEPITHISANEERRNIDVAKGILKILGKPESLISFVADRPGHDWRYALDSTPLRKLGWKPAVDFEEGLRRTVEWYAEKMQRNQTMQKNQRNGNKVPPEFS
ncbi:MAG: dTDP-glucose 4,6-dehydratase [Candidatus Peribacteraceae bacterium]|jgi:dTDP-glucose 4,6-dehydratase